MRIIDAHIHFRPGKDVGGFHDVAARAGQRFSAAALRADLNALGVEKAVVMSNRGLDPAAHVYPDFLRYCAGVEREILTTDTSAYFDRLEANLRLPACVGVKLYVGYVPCYPGEAIWAPALELARDYRKPVAIHTGLSAGGNGRLAYSHPLAVDEAAAAWPDVTFVLCHMGNPWLQDAAAVMNNCKNVVADLSGLFEGVPDVDEIYNEQAGYVAYLDTWMRYAGYEKLLFGSDWPIVNLAKNLEFFLRLVPERFRDAFFYDNAARVYGL